MSRAMAADQFERVEVRILAGLDQIHASVFGHEIPILIHAHGGMPDKVRFLSRGEFAEIEDPEAEYDRLRRAYRRGEDGVPLVDQVYAGGAIAFHQYIAAGGTAIDGLERRQERHGPEAGAAPAGKVQPKRGDDGYLDKKELAAMLTAMTGDSVALKSITRTSLRAKVILALEEALLEASIPIPALETDPEIGRAFRSYEAYRAAQTAAAEG